MLILLGRADGAYTEVLSWASSFLSSASEKIASARSVSRAHSRRRWRLPNRASSELRAVNAFSVCSNKIKARSGGSLLMSLHAVRISFLFTAIRALPQKERGGTYFGRVYKWYGVQQRVQLFWMKASLYHVNTIIGYLFRTRPASKTVSNLWQEHRSFGYNKCFGPVPYSSWAALWAAERAKFKCFLTNTNVLQSPER